MSRALLLLALLLLALLGCTKDQLNRIDPPSSLAGADGGWTPADTQPEDIPSCGTLGCSGGLGAARDAGRE